MEINIKDYQTKIGKFIHRLQDVRFVGLMMFLVVVLLMSWSGIKIIDTNYGLQKQIAELEQQNQVQQLENTNVRLKNDYYQTDQYLELTARQNFGLAAPGETVIVVPKDVALAHTSPFPNQEATASQETASKQPTYQRNFQAWMDFLFHRQAVPNQQ